MDQIVTVGTLIGGLLYGIWTATFGQKKAMRPVNEKQDAMLEAINLTRHEVGSARDEIHDLGVKVDAGDARNDSRFKAQGERIGRLEDRVSRVEGARSVGVTGEAQGRASAGQPAGDPEPPAATAGILPGEES